jgi:predicted ATPase
MMQNQSWNAIFAIKLQFNFMQAKPYLKEIILIRDYNLDQNVYPLNIRSLNFLESMSFHPDVTFIIGENGSGKSTLIEAIALSLGFGFEGGTKNVHYQTAESASLLHKYIKLVKSFKKPKDYFFLRAETFYKVASYADETNYIKGYGGSLHEKSHGEAFMALLTKKMTGNGLYLFDEPEAALSVGRQLAALARIHQLAVEGCSQFIICTHSPILLSYPNATIYQLSDDGIKLVDYQQTEQFMVTKEFLNNHENILKRLLNN